MARRTVVTLVAVVATLSGQGLLLEPATAATGLTTALVTCVGDNTAQFSPGLTYQPQMVTVSGQDTATHCLSVTHPTLHSFVGPFGGNAQLSCADLLSSGSGTETLFWNGGTTLTSTWAWTQSVTQQGTTVVATIVGPITAGVLLGSSLTQIITVPAINFNACNQPAGLTSNTGPSEWAFVGA